MVLTGAPHGCVLGCRSDQCYADQTEGCKGLSSPQIQEEALQGDTARPKCTGHGHGGDGCEGD